LRERHEHSLLLPEACVTKQRVQGSSQSG
jgi:hypothetical protein